MRTRAELRRIVPVFPVGDVPAAVEHYRGLGFDVRAFGDGTEYAFAQRDGVEIQLSHVADLAAPANTSACYLYCDDAGALAAEWRDAPGRLHEPADSGYGLLEGAHLDPWSNLIRFGSPAA